MKAVIAVLLLGVTLCGLSVVGVRAQGAAVTGQFVDEWRDLPYSGSPVSRFGHSFETIDTNMFLFGGIGYNPVPYLVGSTWKFNGLTDTFSNLGLAAPSAPSARVHHAAAVAGTSMFVFGGCTAINVGDLACTSRANDLWEFSSVTNSWAARPIDPTSPVPDARFGASAVTYTNANGETFLVIYGGDSDGTTDDGVYFFEISDGETRFSVQAQTGTRPPQLAEHTAAVYGQYMYVHGGRLANSASTYQTALWRFDLDNFVWTELTSSTDARGGRALVVLDNFFFIFGGTNGGTLTNSLRVYDMEEEAWYTMATGMEARAFTAGGVLDGNVVFFSGMTGTGGGAGSVDGSFRRFFVRPVIDGLTPDSGGNCGGNEVTVSGEMFSAGSLRCTFGDQEVAATFISDTEVKCLAPAVAGDAYGHTDVQVGKVIGDVRLFTVGGGAGNDYEFVEDVSSPVFTEPIAISVGTAGDATTMDFVVQARTSCGTDRTTGGDTVVVDVLDATTLTSLGWAITSSDNGDGTYSFSFFTTAAATYRVEIHLNGAMLQNDMTLADEAFSLLIKAAAVDTVDSTIGTYDAGIIAGNTNQVRILAYDVYDNVVKDASGVAVVATSPEVQVTGTVTYDGVSLLGAVRLTRAGTYVLNVTADGVPVANSPQTIVVAPNVIDAASCTVEGFSTEIKTTAGTPVNLRLTARDVYGNQRNTGGAAFAASLSGTADVPATVSDNGDGTYGIAYEATRIGQYALSVTLGGVHIEDSPFATPVEVGTVVSAAGSYAYGENIGGGRAGTEAQFKIQTRDEWGNNMRTQDVPWEVEIPAAQQDSITIQDNENGRYTVFFTFKHLGYVGGTHEIAVKYEGEHIVGSPYEIDVTAGAWFFVIIVLVVIICAILIGVVGTWACHKVQKKVRYKLLWHDTSTIFPEAAGDHIPEAFSEEQQYMDPINPGTVFFDDMDDPTFDYTATRIIGGADLINSTVDMADVEGWDVPTGDIDAQGRDVGAH